MQTTFDRLRDQFNHYSDPEYLKGRAAGRKWAEESAHARQLLSIATQRGKCPTLAAWADTIPDYYVDAPFYPSQRVGAWIIATGSMGGVLPIEQARQLFEPLGLGVEDSAATYRGFCAGALAVWQAVESQF